MSTDSRVPSVIFDSGPAPGEFCYLFNKSNFFRGNPPPEAVIPVFVKSGPSVYETFPIFYKTQKFWDFLEWDEPIVEATVAAYEKDKTILDPENYENETTPELLERREENDELYEYYNAMDEAGYYACSSDDYEDPIHSFMSLVNNPFHANDFCERMDTLVLEHLSDLNKPLSPENISQCATDVSVGNLQLLNNAAADQIRVQSTDSIPLISKVNKTVWPNHETRFKLHFVDYLTRYSNEAKRIAHTYPSISNVLLHIPDNCLVHTDEEKFDEFIKYYHSPASDLFPKFQAYLKHRGVLDSVDYVETFSNLAKNNADTIKFKDYLDFYEYDHQSNSMESSSHSRPPDNDPNTETSSPSYHPQSPATIDDDYDMVENEDPKETGAQGLTRMSELSLTEDPDPMEIVRAPPLSESEFRMCLVGYINYILHLDSKFRPCNEFSLANFGYANSLDFCKKFRKRFRFFYISQAYQGRLVVDLADFLTAFLKTDEGKRFVSHSLNSN